MKKILVTQRVEKIKKLRENRDNLDIRMSKFLEKLSFLPIPVPNGIKNIKLFVNNLKPSGVVLSGGGDPRIKDQRRKTENYLVKYCLKNKIPIIGICRGAQLLNIIFKGSIKKVKNHVNKKHQIFGELVKKKKIYVNSFHNFGLNEKILGKNLKIIAFSKDGNIECFIHKKFKIIGIMWHPERNNKISKIDSKLFKSLF